jgi:putative transposase
LDLQSYAHSRGQSAYHLVLVPKYRRKAFLRDDIRGCLERYLVAPCRQQGWQLYAMEVMPDHVHMFVELPPSTSVSEAFQVLKGKSSHELFNVFPELRYMFRRGALWSEGKFFRSVGAVRADVVVDYIRKQTHTTAYRPTGRLKFFEL